MSIGLEEKTNSKVLCEYKYYFKLTLYTCDMTVGLWVLWSERRAILRFPDRAMLVALSIIDDLIPVQSLEVSVVIHPCLGRNIKPSVLRLICLQLSSRNGSPSYGVWDYESERHRVHILCLRTQYLGEINPIKLTSFCSCTLILNRN